MSDYFQHWLDMEKSVPPAGLPRIFCVNWFRKEEGKFIWPGFGENMRVLKWMVDRIEGHAGEGTHTLLGTSPRYEDLTWAGLDFSRADFDKLVPTVSAEKEAWRKELRSHQEEFDRLAYHLPEALKRTLARLQEELEKEPQPELGAGAGALNPEP